MSAQHEEPLLASGSVRLFFSQNTNNFSRPWFSDACPNATPIISLPVPGLALLLPGCWLFVEYSEAESVELEGKSVLSFSD